MHPDSVKYFLDYFEELRRDEVPKECAERLFWYGHKILKMLPAKEGHFVSPISGNKYKYCEREARWQCKKCKFEWESEEGLICPACKANAQTIEFNHRVDFLISKLTIDIKNKSHMSIYSHIFKKSSGWIYELKTYLESSNKELAKITFKKLLDKLKQHKGAFTYILNSITGAKISSYKSIEEWIKYGHQKGLI